MKNMYLQGYSFGLVFILFFNFSVEASLLAQSDEVEDEECGFIIETSGFRDGFLDCEDPFEATGISPYTVFFDGTILAAGSSLTIPLPFTSDILIQRLSVNDPNNVLLYRQVGVDYQAVPLEDVVEREQYQVTLTETGNYVLVFNREEAGNAVFDWRQHFFTTAHAQSGEPDEENLEVSFLPFSVTSDTPPTECGFLVFEDGSFPIEDCDNPFGQENLNESLKVIFAGDMIEAGSSYELLDVVGTFDVTNIDNQATDASVTLWRHQGEDYVQELDYNPRRSNPDYRFTATGTYSLVIEEAEAPVVSDAWLEQLRALFITPVHAAVGDVTIIEFTVTASQPPEPTGASSVLFLPGIQASRLYAGEDISIPGVFNDVNENERVWEPGNNNDVRALTMNTEGDSVNSIYTEDVIDEIPFIGSNIYKGFGNFLDDLVDDEVISEWAPFAYDWRYDVFDVVADGTLYENERVYPIEEVRRLAAGSKSGEVTIVAHSNGGLLAKAIMHELGTEAADLIDDVIFIGTPHLGTPKALGTVLHGYDQEKVGGLVIDDVVARSVINNLPGAYSLLPSEAYIEKVGQPLIVFDDSDTTAAFRQAYGFGVNGFAEFSDFMKAADGVNRANPADGPINEPVASNGAQFDTAQINHAEILDSFVPPTGIETHQIVGTGLATMKAIEYREITETVCETASGDSTPVTCIETKLLKPYAQLTRYGDETVVSASAEAVGNMTNQFYVDLSSAGEDPFTLERTHEDLTESEPVQTLVENILTDSTTPVNFVSDSEPFFSDSYDVEVIDSPVQIATRDTAGNITGIVEEGGDLVIKEEIPGSRYFEFGGSKYLITPSEVERTTELRGEAFGGYTLTIATLTTDDEQVMQSQLTNATVTPDMQAMYTKTADGFSTIETDLDGDGDFETETTLAGEVIMDEATYETLRQAIKDAELRKREERKLLLIAHLAERFSEHADRKRLWARLEGRFLQKLSRWVRYYERRDKISGEDAQNIYEIINKIKND